MLLNLTWLVKSNNSCNIFFSQFIVLFLNYSFQHTYPGSDLLKFDHILLLQLLNFFEKDIMFLGKPTVKFTQYL